MKFSEQQAKSIYEKALKLFHVYAKSPADRTEWRPFAREIEKEINAMAGRSILCKDGMALSLSGENGQPPTLESCMNWLRARSLL